MAEMERERDLVLSPNEFCYVLDKTKGIISTLVGSTKMSLSNSDSLVVFSEEEKRFKEATAQEAIKTFISAPENWYVVLKNPAKDNIHPRTGTSNVLPDLEIGKKINIRGPVSFPLYPGQMAKVIQGHRLHSNQYLIARVYDPEFFGKDKYTTGQLLVIKGTEVQFFIPGNGMEVIPAENGEFIRDAVTLERLEYGILKNEEGEKRYIHGPAVVFPEPDETFVVNPENNSYIFKAIELSEISGIYLKVIADYSDGQKLVGYENVENDDGEVESKPIYEDIIHKAGEELFITGNTQKIYYPRPEHAIITYDGKVLHHAIAIPNGEGRYVLNRQTGDIKMVKGPAMYLPDPRYEVIVKRKLTKQQCNLWYPGNKEVMEYNVPQTITYASLDSLPSSSVTFNNSGITYATYTASVASENLANGFVGMNNASVEQNAGFSRGNTYSKPRMITIDNKFDGAVTINIWTGYAVNVTSKSGGRKVITGPCTYLLEYDEDLEVLQFSTGTPKCSDKLEKSVYLRTENNKVSDVINVQTADFVDINVYVSYCVNFMPDKKDSWFLVDDYVKFLTDRERSLIKREAKKYSVEEFYNNATDIIRGIILGEDGNAGYFKENGMKIMDVEILNVIIGDENINTIINNHQHEMISKALNLSAANKDIIITSEIAKIEKEELDLKYANEMHRIELDNKIKMEDQKKKDEYARIVEESQKAQKEAEKQLQVIKGEILKLELAASKEKTTQELNLRKEQDKLEIEKQKAYTDAVKKVIDSISPDLIAALQSSSNADMLVKVAESIAPYALAGNDESVADVVNKLTRGTSLEGLLDKVVKTE